MKIWKKNLRIWGLLSGGKRHEGMLHRPLILLLIFFTGGILFAHNFLSTCPNLILPVFICTAFFLISLLFIPRNAKIPCLLAAFFLTGILLDMGQHRPSQIFSIVRQHKKITIEGTILEPAKVTGKMAKFTLQTHGLFVEGRAVTVSEKIIVSVYNHVPDLRVGEKILFPARLKSFKNFNNPGGYDYESAMKLKGLTCSASVSDGRGIVPVGSGILPLHRKWLENIQSPIRNFFKENLCSEGSALFRAIILGERQAITKELREPFNKTGLGHVLAVSGLHIGLVAWIAFVFFKWCLSRPYAFPLKIDIKKPAALLTCLPVLGYLFIAGFQVSSQRAMIMIFVFLLSLILGREKEIWSTLALAGLLILAVDPNAVFSMSFQLSFSAVAGILWLTPVILGKIPAPEITGQKTILNGLYSYFTGLIAVCIAATLFLLPIVLIFFHRIPIVSIPANLMVVPILGLWVIPLGLLSTITLPFSICVADVFLQMGMWGLNIMMDILRFWSDVPWCSFWMVTPNVFEMILFYLFIFFIFFFKHRSWAKIGALIVTVLVLADAAYWINRVHFNKELRVSFIDVGQANAALVEFPGGEKMMIDGGGFSRDNFDVGRMVIAPVLWHFKIQKIDYLVLSHPQSDHMNGLRFIAQAFAPEEFWYNGDNVETSSFKKLIKIIEEKNVKKLLPRDLAGGRLINGVSVKILNPKPDEIQTGFFPTKSRLNNNSLVVKISHCGKSFLFPGDLEEEGERYMIANAGDSIRSHVLLSPHHGSKSSSSKKFLEIVDPDICVISSGENNFFGFPHKQTLKRLQDIGCRIIRIDQQGAAIFRVGQDLFEVTTFILSNPAGTEMPKG